MSSKETSNNEVRINLNEVVKFKLTDHGKEIFFHQYDEINKFIIEHGGKPIEPEMPKVDEDGYTRMQLWHFMELYGPFTHMAAQNCICPLEIIYTPEN